MSITNNAILAPLPPPPIKTLQWLPIAVVGESLRMTYKDPHSLAPGSLSSSHAMPPLSTYTPAPCLVLYVNICSITYCHRQLLCHTLILA